MAGSLSNSYFLPFNMVCQGQRVTAALFGLGPRESTDV